MLFTNLSVIIKNNTLLGAYQISPLSFEELQQLGRRNLTPERRKYLIGKRYEAEKQVFQNRGNQYTFAKKNATNQNDPCQNKSGSHVTRQRIANETGTSEGYVQRAEKYMNGVEAADEAAPGAREEILNGKIKAADREICAIAKAPKEQRSEIVAELRKPKSEQDKQLASSTKSPSVKVESFDDDGSRFLIGISKKVQGHKRALTESDQKALKKSVEASADHSIHIAAIEGAYDAFKTGKDCILREFEDKRAGSSSALVQVSGNGRSRHGRQIPQQWDAPALAQWSGGGADPHPQKVHQVAGCAPRVPTHHLSRFTALQCDLSTDDLRRRCESRSGNNRSCQRQSSGQHLCTHPAGFPEKAG